MEELIILYEKRIAELHQKNDYSAIDIARREAQRVTLRLVVIDLRDAIAAREYSS